MSIHFILNSTASPSWNQEPVDVETALEQSIVIACSANGFPKPTITWVKIGTHFIANNFYMKRLIFRIKIFKKGAIIFFNLIFFSIINCKELLLKYLQFSNTYLIFYCKNCYKQVCDN